MEIVINILKVISSKDTWLPLITTFLGAFFAFQFNFYLLKKVKKNEQIANLNYLIVTLNNYLRVMEFLDDVVKQRIQAVKNCQKYCNEHKKIPLNTSDDLLKATAQIILVRPLTQINIVNYAFADKNTDFVSSLINATRFIEEIFLILETAVNVLTIKFMNQHKDKEPILKDLQDFLCVHCNNLSKLRDRVFESVIDICECNDKLAEYNKKYLNYKLAYVPMSEDLHKLLTKATKFFEEQSRNP